MTSTLLNAIAGLVQREHGKPASDAPRLPGAAWVTYGIGALIGVLTVPSWDAGAVAIPLVVVGMAAAPALQRMWPSARAHSTVLRIVSRGSV